MIVVKPHRRQGYVYDPTLTKTVKEAQRRGIPIDERTVARGERRAKAKRASTKAKKTRAANDAAAVKAVRDAAAQREVDENAAGDAETRPEAVEAQADQAPELDEPAPKKRKQGRQKGYSTPKAEIERQEQIKEAMEYRLMGYTYRQIAEQMEVAAIDGLQVGRRGPGRYHAGDGRGAAPRDDGAVPPDHSKAHAADG